MLACMKQSKNLTVNMERSMQKNILTLLSCKFRFQVERNHLGKDISGQEKQEQRNSKKQEFR